MLAWNPGYHFLGLDLVDYLDCTAKKAGLSQEDMPVILEKPKGFGDQKVFQDHFSIFKTIFNIRSLHFLLLTDFSHMHRGFDRVLTM